MIATEEISPKEAVTGLEAPITGGWWAWFVQRVTAVLLIFFLGAHWGILHFVLSGEAITFERVTERFGSPAYLALDIALLATVLYHALNGLWVIITDYGLGWRGRRMLAVALIIIGIITFIYGTNALLPFTGRQPLFSWG
ncbi:MAG: succinate dehydrogenase, hydrophobic membrane anchor protein [Chloroflexi bacterium]|nr:succinate dehydrogenase, hydrophobic membrane anchor protein [Chloroflexota bacterium]